MAPSFFYSSPDSTPVQLSVLHSTNRHPQRHPTHSRSLLTNPYPPDWFFLRHTSIKHLLYTLKPNRSLGNRKLRSNCRIVQRTGISPTPYSCSAYLPCAVERQRFPLATERGRSILHRYSIVIASLLDRITENKARSRQHRAEIERPKWG